MAKPKRSERLQIVLQIAQQKEEESQKELARQQGRLNDEQAKLEQLQQFQLDYQNNLRAQAGRRMSAAQYQSYNHFINRLATAIQEQQRQVALVQVQVTRARDLWRECYQKRKNMGDFIDRCRDEEARDFDKREQRILDDAAQAAAVRRRS